MCSAGCWLTGYSAAAFSTFTSNCISSDAFGDGDLRALGVIIERRLPAGAKNKRVCALITAIGVSFSRNGGQVLFGPTKILPRTVPQTQR
jgi:hypothetical protein